MRKLLKKIFQILDGTPAVYGHRQRGQSVIELAFITPLLIILIAGIVEVGWYANNYLILLEVTRVGARRGTVLRDQFSPLAWDDYASRMYGLGLNNDIPNNAPDFLRDQYETAAKNYRTCNFIATYPGFYNEIVCRMLDSLTPLQVRLSDPLKGTTEVDDIVVSVFALRRIDNETSGGDINFTTYGMSGTNYPVGNKVYVVGRYPTRANECNVAPNGSLIPFPTSERDPFDYIKNDGPTCRADTCGAVAPNPVIYLELPGYDPGPEKQRGFVFLGQHKVAVDQWNPTPVDCYGSQWTISRVEQAVNLIDPNTGQNLFGLSNTQKQFLPTKEGLVLVEMFWRHELLLAFPLFSPVYNILGDRPVISVWAAFPVPAVEPNIQFK